MNTGAPVALVTGASRGIGAASARALAIGGYDLLLTARSESELAERANEIGAETGRSVSMLAADLSQPDSARFLVEAAVERFGTLDALVHCAGMLRVSRLLDISDEEIAEAVALNLVAPIRLSREAASVMVPRRRGRIVHVVSTFAFVSARGYGLYSATKAGLVGFTKSLALELVSDGVQVNGIAPGQVRTPMLQSAIDRFGEARIARHIPAGRIADASEIAAAVRYLVIDAPSFMTGDVMIIDGGYLCR